MNIQFIDCTRAAFPTAPAAGPPAGFTGVLGPNTGEAPVTSESSDSARGRAYTPAADWLASTYQGGMHYASYSAAVARHYEQPFHAFVKTVVEIWLIKDNGDFATWEALLNGVAVAGVSGTTQGGAVLYKAGEVTAEVGTHTIRVRLTGGVTLYSSRLVYRTF